MCVERRVEYRVECRVECRAYFTVVSPEAVSFAFILKYLRTIDATSF